MPRVPLAACLLLLTACPRPPENVPDASADACGGACLAGERCDEAARACVLDVAPRCTAGIAWTPGTPAFADESAAWGLTGNFAGGTRISSADLDRDGRLDVIVRRAGNHRDDPAGARAVWALRNAGDRFVDVTASSGLLQNRVAGSAVGRPAEVVVFADVDNDGDLDAFTGASASATETSEVMLNAGNGTFSLGPSASDVRLTDDSIGGASFADVNRDGRVDLWVGGGSKLGQGSQDRLYVGDGAGAFIDVTAASGLSTLAWTSASVADLNAARAHTPSWGTAACDLNGDGWPELLSSSYGRAPNHLWQATGSGESIVYVNRSLASGYSFDHRTDWTDNESARCYCKLHPTAADCAGVPPPAVIVCNSDQDVFRWNHTFDREPFRLGGNSGTTACGDVDADGDLDLLTTEIVHWDVGSSSDPSELLVNSGESDVRFVRPGNEVMGLTRTHSPGWNDGDITGALFDFDNDGRLDVYIGSTDYPGTRGLLYHQTAAGTFEPVAISDGIDHKSSHGIAVGDFDRDGDLDLVVGHSQARCPGDHCYPDSHARFFKNLLGQEGNWVQLQLEGAGGSNRAAIGARVTIATPGRSQTFEVGGGHGHYGLQHDLVVHAGLGAACEADVTVRWPDAAGTTQTFKLPSGYRFKLVQGGRPSLGQ